MNKASPELSQIWLEPFLGTYKPVEVCLLFSSSVKSARRVTLSLRTKQVNEYLFLHTVFLTGLLSFHLLQNSISLVINYHETQLLQMQKHIKWWQTAERKRQELLQFIHLIRYVYSLNTFNYNLLLFLRLERQVLPVQWYYFLPDSFQSSKRQWEKELYYKE